MKRLIDADELRKRMYHAAFEQDSDLQRWDSGCWIRYKLFEQILDDMPTQSARKPGHWVDDGKGFYKCTACGEAWSHWWSVMVPPDRMCKELQYCPKCGAYMQL